MFGEGRGVEHDEVVGVGRHIVEKLEGVAGKRAVARTLAEVQGHVGVGKRDGLLGGIDRIDRYSAAAEGVDGESARIAEHVEHSAAARIVPQQRAVVALVEKESRFLPPEPVDIEFQGVFRGYRGLESSHEISILRVEMGLVGECGLGFIIYVAHAQAGERSNLLGYGLAGVVHAGRMGL